MTRFIASTTDIGIDPIPAASLVEVGVDLIASRFSQDIGVDASSFLASLLKDNEDMIIANDSL